MFLLDKRAAWKSTEAFLPETSKKKNEHNQIVYKIYVYICK